MILYRELYRRKCRRARRWGAFLNNIIMLLTPWFKKKDRVGFAKF